MLVVLCGLGIMLNISTNRRSHIAATGRERRSESRTGRSPRRAT
jgi:hypothetical protein